MNKHFNCQGWWTVPDEFLAPPAREDQCLDCGVRLRAVTSRELALLVAAHGRACSRRCVVCVGSAA